MAKFTDLIEWDSLNQQEKNSLKAMMDIKDYKNYDGRQSYSPKEMKKSALYQKSIEK